MEIMAGNLSDDIRLSEGPLATMDNRNNTVLDANKETSSILNVESEIPSHHVESTTTPSGDGISISADEVDSALLYAMRDQRERVALLRLERTMVDFMNNQDMPYMDVGGPNNSIVIHPNSNTPGKTTPANMVGRQQTSFQRCCLHRLADRFHIVRETTPSSDNGGMIRLVKVKDSQIPNKLLIDLELPPENNETTENESADVRALTKKLSDSSIKKMKIMKRSSSSMGSSSSLKNSAADNSSTRNRKNLSDKEKAYAEARARIFNNADLLKSSEEETTTTTTSATPPQATPPERVSPCLIMEQQQQQQPTTTTDSSSSFSNKATWRNRREEENDPDFYRLAPQTSFNYDVYGAASPYGCYPQPPYFSAGSQQQQQQSFAPYTSLPPAAPYNGGAEAYYPPLSSPAYYQGGGRGRGGGGGRGVVPPKSARGESRRANVNCMDEFPSLA